MRFNFNFRWNFSLPTTQPILIFHMGVPNHVPRTHKRRLSIGLGDMDTKLGRYTTRVRGKKTD